MFPISNSHSLCFLILELSVNNAGLVLSKCFLAFLIGGLEEGMDFALR